MKKLLMLCVLAACELQPAPKQAPPPAPAGSAAQDVVATPADAAVVVAAPDAAPPPPVQTTADCQKTAVRYTDLLIAAAPAAQKGIFEQDRVNIVRRTEVACTQQGWTSAAMACIDQSKNDRDARACLDKFPAPGAQPAGSGQGSGSAAPREKQHPSPPR